MSIMRGTKSFPNSLCNKHLCGSPTDSGGDSRDHDIFAFAVRHCISPKMITVHPQYGQRTSWLAVCQGVQCSVCRIRRKQTAKPSFLLQLRNSFTGVSATYRYGTSLLPSTSRPTRSTVIFQIAGHSKPPSQTKLPGNWSWR